MRGWRYCGWVAPGEVTWWNACWLIGDWWDWSETLDCEVKSLCVLGFCWERPI